MRMELLRTLLNCKNTAPRVEKPQFSSNELFKSQVEEWRLTEQFIPHEKFGSSLSAKLEVRHSPEKGRYVVAKEAIEFGERLAVLQPNVACVSDASDLCQCHHCMQRFHLNKGSGMSFFCIFTFKLEFLFYFTVSLPCNNCSGVLYCSESCRNDSLNLYHRYECAHLGMLYELHHYHLALRLLYTAGLDQIQSVIFNPEGLPENPLDICDPVAYRHYYLLEQGVDQFSYQQLLDQTLTACLLTKLALSSGFFDDKSKQTFSEKLVGGLLLRHTFQVTINSGLTGLYPHQHLLPTNPGEINTVVLEKNCFIEGFFLNVPFSLMFNHSCNSNAKAFSFQHVPDNIFPDDIIPNQSKGVVRATRSIEAGEQVAVNYCSISETFVDNLDRRQAQILKSYLFDCKCAICVAEKRDNLLIDEEEEKKKKIFGVPDSFQVACDKCSSLVDRSSGEFRCVSTTCGAQFSLEEIRMKMTLIKFAFYHVIFLYSQITNKPNYGLDNQEEIETFIAEVESMFNETLKSMLYRGSWLKLAVQYVMIGLWLINAKTGKSLKICVALFEKSLALMEDCYGPKSIQVMIILKDLLKSYGIANRKFPSDVQMVNRANKLKQREEQLRQQMKF